MGKGEPEPKIKWLKDDKEIVIKKKDKRFAIAWDIAEDLNTLQIKDAISQDSGMYTIEATNDLGTVQSTVSVTVSSKIVPKEEAVNEAVTVGEITTQEKVVQESDEEEEKETAEISVVPEILIKPEDLQVTPGGTIKLSCKIKG